MSDRSRDFEMAGLVEFGNGLDENCTCATGESYDWRCNKVSVLRVGEQFFCREHKRELGSLISLTSPNSVGEKLPDSNSLSEKQAKAIHTAAEFVRLLHIPDKNVHQITNDICEDVQGLDIARGDAIPSLGGLVYRINVTLDVCRKETLDYWILTALEGILSG